MIELSLIAAIIFLTFCSGYFSASEIALFSLPSMKIKSYQNDADPRKQLIAKLVLRPRDLLVTIFMLNTLVNILIQNVSANLFGDLSGWVWTVGFPLVLTLLFGEFLPKYLALQKNVAISYGVAPVIYFLQNFLEPVRKAVIAVTAPISTIMFFFLRKEKSIASEELQHMLKTSQEYEVLHADEAELIQGYLNLEQTTVHDVMQPRAEMLFYDMRDPLSKITHLFVVQNLSRVPVCETAVDNILGIITAETFFLQRDLLKQPSDLLPLLSKPFFVPETTPARVLMRRLDEKNEGLAIAVDEYGAISGLITKADLVEVVIGKIADKRDHHVLYTRAGPDVIIASGKLELSDFKEIFGIELKSASNKVTIGGWLIENLGEIPKSGTKYVTKEFLFQVLSAQPNRIRRLYIRKLNSDKRNTL